MMTNFALQQRQQLLRKPRTDGEFRKRVTTERTMRAMRSAIWMRATKGERVHMTGREV